MVELTPAQEQAVDRSPDVPPRLTDPATGRTEVLLAWDDFEWVRGLLGDEPDSPHRTDARTGRVYAVLPLERYERFKAFFEEDPLTPAEQKSLLREAGKRAGWEDRAWDDHTPSAESP